MLEKTGYLNKERALSRIDDLKLLVSQAEAVHARNEKLKKTVANLLSQFVTKDDVGRTVRFSYGPEEIALEGTLVRAPSADHQTFTVEFGEPGAKKRLSRNPAAFLGFVN